jgi:hypothetical protein
MNAIFQANYCGIEFDASAYRSLEDFAADVWSAVFHDRDGQDTTANATRWANEAQARAEYDWKQNN